MHVLMEVFGTGRPKVLETFATFDLASAALIARPDLVFSEPDPDHPGCADAFLSDGRLLVIEPADRRT
ncbi:MAG: hypothetical protein ACRYG4_09045 [Janthinobacterium lividum]